MLTAYRALLYLYPKSFRAEYGDEMTAVFARELRSASGGGAVLFLARTFFDTLVNAARVHGDITKQDLKYALRSLGRTPGFTDHRDSRRRPRHRRHHGDVHDCRSRAAAAAAVCRSRSAGQALGDTGLARLFPPRALTAELSRLEAAGQVVRRRRGLRRRHGHACSGTASPSGSSGTRVTGGVFHLLGRQAAIGRTLTEADITSDQNPIVISDRLWRNRFAGDRRMCWAGRWRLMTRRR